MAKKFWVHTKETVYFSRVSTLIFSEELDQVNDCIPEIRGNHEYLLRTYDVIGTDADTEQTIKQRFLNCKEIKEECNQEISDIEVVKVEYLGPCNIEAYDEPLTMP